MYIYELTNLLVPNKYNSTIPAFHGWLLQPLMQLLYVNWIPDANLWHTHPQEYAPEYGLWL